MKPANDNAFEGLNLRSLCDHPAFPENVAAAILKLRELTIEHCGRLPTPEELSKCIRTVVEAHEGTRGLQ